MPAQKIEIAPELIAEGRRLYEETDTPIHDIAVRMQITRSTLNARIREWCWTRRRSSAAGPPISAAPAETRVGDGAAAPAEADLPFAQRMQRVVDAQLSVIERTLRVLEPASNAEAERTARILAAISRTVQEIQAAAEGQRPDETDDDAVPGDIDEFRETLARRLQGFIDARRQEASDGDGGLGAGIDRG